jgi:hypothetical protein
MRKGGTPGLGLGIRIRSGGWSEGPPGRGDVWHALTKFSENEVPPPLFVCAILKSHNNDAHIGVTYAAIL